MILVVSPDRDFSHTLAEQIVRELGEPCECMEQLQDIANTKLIITTDQGTKNPTIPVIVIGNKPLRMRQLLNDIASQLAPTDAANIECGEFCLLRQYKILKNNNNNKEIGLTGKEQQLFLTLVEAGDAGISREALLKAVWGFEEGVNTHTLETHIYRLRAKIKDVSGSETIISTLEDGYRLTL